MTNDFFKRAAKRRPPNPFMEPWEIAAAHNHISLPRVARIQGETFGKDRHHLMIHDAWGCKPVEGHHDDHYADYTFPEGWRIRRAEWDDHPAELLDPLDDARAEIIGPEEIYGAPMLSILPRYHVVTRYDLDERVRVVAVDRRSNRSIRQTVWISPNEQALILRQIAEYTEWLNEVKPDHCDVFAYWGDV